MFEITDEFLTQAGFGSLSDDQKNALKEQVTLSVQRKIGDRIVNQVGEERAEELGALMDGNLDLAKSVVERIDENYEQSEFFTSIQELGRANNATDDDILREFAILSWMKHEGVNITTVIQASMDEALVELRTIYEQATKAVSGNGEDTSVE